MAIPEEYGKKGTPLQNTRHTWILERLNNGEVLSITELSKEWDVSTKTLQRDFDKLNKMLPREIERANDGKKYQKAKNHIAQNDSEIIIDMLEGMVRDIGGATYTKAHKLLSDLKMNIHKPMYARIDVEDVSDKFKLITQLEKAISDKEALSIMYHRWYDGNNNKKYENVHPFKIVIYNGFWYLLAEHQGYFKKFYLKEIQSCIFEQKKFTPDSKILERIENSLNIWFEPNNDPFEVTLWLDMDAVVYFERKPIAKSQRLYKKPDGTAELVVKVTHEREIYPIVKHWLPTIRILEPESMQVEFETMLQDYLSMTNSKTVKMD